MTVVAADRFDLAGQLVRRAFDRDDDVGNVLVVDTSIVVVVGQVDHDRRRMDFAADERLELLAKHKRRRGHRRSGSKNPDFRETDRESIAGSQPDRE